MQTNFRVRKNAHPLVMVIVGLALIGGCIFAAHKDRYYLTHGVEVDGKITKLVRMLPGENRYIQIEFKTTSGQQVLVQSSAVNRLPLELRTKLTSPFELEIKPKEMNLENCNLHQKILYLPDNPQEAMVKPENRDFLGIILIASVGGLMIVIGIWQQLKRTREGI